MGTTANELSPQASGNQAQGASVTEEYKERENRFTGKIDKVAVEVKECVKERNGASLPA